jgi:hypothetical protein
VVQGRISGTVSSLSPFTIVTETIGLDTGIGNFDPCIIVSGCTSQPTDNCGFKLQVDPPPDCPGNQTRGNWVIENGVPTPRLFATTCDCYVPSLVTVDTIIALATGIGTIKAGICASRAAILSLNIPSLVSFIKDLRFWIDDALRTLANYMEDLRILKIEISDLNYQWLEIKNRLYELMYDVLPDLLDDFWDIVEGITGRDPRNAVSQDELAEIVREAGEQYNRWKNDPSIPDPSGLFRRWTQNADDTLQANKEIDNLAELRNIKLHQRDSKIAQQDWTTNQIKDLEETVDVAKLQLQDAVAELATKEGQKASLLRTIYESTRDVFVTTSLMYSYLNEISVKKTCPEGETLNPLTCECCPNCTGDKVFPDPMSGCNCVCPPGTEACLSASDDGCYPPCPEGKIRTGSDCNVCRCIPPGCPEGVGFDPETCECLPPSSSSTSESSSSSTSESSSSSSSSTEECVANQNCCMFVGEYHMLCSDASATSACTDAGGVFYCDDYPYGICYFNGKSTAGPCGSLTAPFPPSGNYPIFGPYGGPGGGPCGLLGLPVSNCFRSGHCCDGECRGEECS